MGDAEGKSRRTKKLEETIIGPNNRRINIRREKTEHGSTRSDPSLTLDETTQRPRGGISSKQKTRENITRQSPTKYLAKQKNAKTVGKAKVDTSLPTELAGEGDGAFSSAGWQKPNETPGFDGGVLAKIRTEICPKELRGLNVSGVATQSNKLEPWKKE